MKLDQGLFTVVKGETVTITITPSSDLGAGQAVANRDQGAQPTLIFVVDKDVGHEHFVDVVFGFEGATAGANYKIRINGNGAGNAGPFDRVVDLNSPGQPQPKRSYRFRVVG